MIVANLVYVMKCVSPKKVFFLNNTVVTRRYTNNKVVGGAIPVQIWLTQGSNIIAPKFTPGKQ